MAIIVMPCGVTVMVAVIALHGAVAVVIVITSLWPHYHHAIGAQ